MKEITILIPDFEKQEYIEIDVKVSGSSVMKYRIEPVNWLESASLRQDRFSIVKNKIDDYDNAWELIKIGSPKETSVPLIFRQKSF